MTLLRRILGLGLASVAACGASTALNVDDGGSAGVGATCAAVHGVCVERAACPTRYGAGPDQASYPCTDPPGTCCLPHQ